MKTYTFHVKGSEQRGDFWVEDLALGWVSRKGNNHFTRESVLQEFRSMLPHCKNIRISRIEPWDSGDMTGFSTFSPSGFSQEQAPDKQIEQ